MNGRRRSLLLLAGLAVLVGTAGCLSAVSDEDLAEDASYDWETDANATYTLYAGNFTAVLDIQDGDAMDLFREDGLGTESPLAISSLQFRYANGTVVNDSAFDVETGRSRVTIEPPAPNGTVAFTAPRSGPDFHTRVLVEGSHEVILPPGKQVGLPVVSRVVPGNYTAESVGDRTVVRWGSVDRNTISVKTYLERDLLIFGGIAGIALLVGLVGLVYYRRQIAALRAQREELGLDVGEEDDDPRDRGPPPGMG